MGKSATDLDKRELVDLLEIVQTSLTVRSDDELKDLLLRVRALVPCMNIVSGLGKLGSSGHLKDVVKVVNASYPDDWLGLYFEKDYSKVDPALNAFYEQGVSQVWSSTFRRVTSQSGKEFIWNARSFGLSQGITLGIIDLQHSCGSVFSFAGKSIANHSRDKFILESLAPHLHLALLRTLSPPSDKNYYLTFREKEVLEWVKEGKTSWETSHILHISERTVNFHVQNILAKLQVSTRGQAVALAIEQGLIGLPSSTQGIQTA